MADPPSATVTGRVLAIVGAFDEQHRELGLSEIARRAGLPMSTAHRLVGDLVEHGALARDGRQYQIGRRLWDVGRLAPVQSSLRRAASPFLHDLYTATQATVHIGVRDGDRALFLDRLTGRRSVPVVSTVGTALPIHATAVGKVLLAHAPDDVQARVLASLTAVTAKTITDRRVLGRQLDRIRRDGYATSEEEMSPGACSVAVPVRRAGEVVAALGIVVPALAGDHGRMLTALQVAASGIGRQL